jgi:hypothetical protein
MYCRQLWRGFQPLGRFADPALLLLLPFGFPYFLPLPASLPFPFPSLEHELGAGLGKGRDFASPFSFLFFLLSSFSSARVSESEAKKVTETHTHTHTMNKPELIEAARRLGISVTEINYGIFNTKPAYAFAPARPEHYPYRDNLSHVSGAFTRAELIAGIRLMAERMKIKLPAGFTS